jgi:hypothetical protein
MGIHRGGIGPLEGWITLEANADAMLVVEHPLMRQNSARH